MLEPCKICTGASLKPITDECFHNLQLALFSEALLKLLCICWLRCHPGVVMFSFISNNKHGRIFQAPFHMLPCWTASHAATFVVSPAQIYIEFLGWLSFLKVNSIRCIQNIKRVHKKWMKINILAVLPWPYIQSLTRR